MAAAGHIQLAPAPLDACALGSTWLCSLHSLHSALGGGGWGGAGATGTQGTRSVRLIHCVSCKSVCVAPSAMRGARVKSARGAGWRAVLARGLCVEAGESACMVLRGGGMASGMAGHAASAQRTRTVLSHLTARHAPPEWTGVEDALSLTLAGRGEARARGWVTSSSPRLKWRSSDPRFHRCHQRTASDGCRVERPFRMAAQPHDRGHGRIDLLVRYSRSGSRGVRRWSTAPSAYRRCAGRSRPSARPGRPTRPRRPFARPMRPSLACPSLSLPFGSSWSTTHGAPGRRSGPPGHPRSQWLHRGGCNADGPRGMGRPPPSPSRGGVTHGRCPGAAHGSRSCRVGATPGHLLFFIVPCESTTPHRPWIPFRPRLTMP